jgi:hypothetical protein
MNQSIQQNWQDQVTIVIVPGSPPQFQMIAQRVFFDEHGQARAQPLGQPEAFAILGEFYKSSMVTMATQQQHSAIVLAKESGPC